MNKILKVLLWIWQLPQHLVAMVILLLHKEWQDDDLQEQLDCRCIKAKNNYIVEHFFNSGISLGEYVFLDDVYEDHPKYLQTVRHEYGHTRQSRMFGPLYLLVIGLPSLINNLKSRKYNKDDWWYYNRYPEKWADVLGKVERTY